MMKITNFRDLVLLDENSAVAKVDVTTGNLFWKKTETKLVTVEVFAGKPFGFWRWVDTGRFTLGTQVENLYSSYTITQKLVQHENISG
jgi:hypothetical protein